MRKKSFLIACLALASCSSDQNFYGAYRSHDTDLVFAYNNKHVFFGEYGDKGIENFLNLAGQPRAEIVENCIEAGPIVIVYGRTPHKLCSGYRFEIAKVSDGIQKVQSYCYKSESDCNSRGFKFGELILEYYLHEGLLKKFTFLPNSKEPINFQIIDGTPLGLKKEIK